MSQNEAVIVYFARLYRRIMAVPFLTVLKARLAQKPQTGSVRSYATKNIKPLKMISFNK